MTAMSAVAMEQVQQRAGREEKEGPVLEHVRAVLSDQEEPRDREKRPEHPAAAAAGTMVFVRMLRHDDLCYQSLPDLSAMTAHPTPSRPATTNPTTPSSGTPSIWGPACVPMTIADPTTIDAMMSANASRLLACRRWRSRDPPL